ncbi:MAG TPA: polyprenyl synthetase family protein [Ktedonobacterales bacterium]|nr:polyprenyl synthetase family protein [Ktedonobacterales bacterium]
MSDTATLSRLFAAIEPDLEVVDREFQRRASSGLDIMDAAAAHAISSPGKRLRTALTLLSGRLFHYDFEKLLPLSVAFEMTHLATLVHDDIIDRADTRRGIPTVNARYGDQVAILLGDYLFAKTAGLIADVGDFRIDRLFSDTVATVSEGAIIELRSARRMDVSVEHYLERVNRKTACLIGACCKGGAIVGSASDAQIALMHEYGLNLGIAFQIIDDVLDYTGSVEIIGKPAGNDLRQGLVTLPLIFALRNEHNGRLDQAQRLFQSQTPMDEEVEAVVRWVNGTLAIDESLTLARHYAARANALLTELNDSEDRQTLVELIDFVVSRSH